MTDDALDSRSNIEAARVLLGSVIARIGATQLAARSEAIHATLARMVAALDRGPDDP